MPRVTSQKTRQMLLVTGDPLNPFILPERVQLYNEAGQTVDVTQDPSKMRWAGVWSVDNAYVWNDVVMDTGNLYILTNPAGLPAGSTRPKDSATGDWFLLTVAPPPPPPAFRGAWSEAVAYPVGAMVRHAGGFYGTTAAVQAVEPGVPVGANWGGAVKGRQTRTTDKIDNGVPKIITFGVDTGLDTDGFRSAVIGIDFAVGEALANLNLHVVNHSNRNVYCSLYSMTPSLQGGLGYAGPDGAVTNLPINIATFFGGSGDYILFVDGTTADIVGDVEFTLTGANLNPPDLANPWQDLLA